MQPAAATPQQVSLLWLAGLHVAALVVGHVLGSKSAELGPFLVTLTVLTFPVTFLTTDLVNELQGREWARRVTAIGLVAVGFAYALIELARRLPVAIGSHLPPDAFDHVMALPFAHVIALLAGYFFGQIVTSTCSIACACSPTAGVCGSACSSARLWANWRTASL